MKNPCTGKCYDYDFKKDYCKGCGLSLKERGRWLTMTSKEKSDIIKRIREEEAV